jgi:hypothetical protein
MPSVTNTDTLLLCAGFFGYAAEIKRELERRGRVVALFEDRPATDTLTKGLVRVAPSLVRRRADTYFVTIAERFKDAPIRDVVVIKGEALPPSTIIDWRQCFPQACFTLYFWDSYRNMPGDNHEKVGLFDRALTFDPNDAATDPRLIFRPLFFLPEYANLPRETERIDLLFVGTVHSDRYAVLKRIARALPPGKQLTSILYLRSRLLYRIQRIVDPSLWRPTLGSFTVTPVKKTELLALVARARIVVDIERTIQNGFTMRSVEMLGAGKKMISTNAALLNADFYHPQNIAIIDRRNPVLTTDFLDSPYRSQSPELLRRYSLSGWLDDVLPPRRGEHNRMNDPRLARELVG